jgi:hypothetical protein
VHETVHRWSDGYGASLELTLVHGLAEATDAKPYAYLVAVAGNETTAPADVMVDADDLRGLAEAANAMADLLDAEAGKA